MKMPKDMTGWEVRPDGLWARRKFRKGWPRGWEFYYERVCKTCGEKMLADKSNVDRNPNCGKYCSVLCLPHPRGKATGNWKGGKFKQRGYIYVQNPGHPNADKKGYVAESSLVASGMYGRPIAKGEVVHHMNENRADNRQFNLVVLSRGEHSAVHLRLRQRIGKTERSRDGTFI